MMILRHKAGFTLAELLVALAILGVIATFTIPKILQANQNQKYNAIAKESAAMMSNALQLYQVKNPITAATSFGDLTPYLNYVQMDNTPVIDMYYGSGSWNCTNGTCFKLHSGAIINFALSESFAGTTPSVNAICFLVDPDGMYSGSTTGQGKSTQFCMYVNGRLTTRQNIMPSTVSATGTISPCGACDPPYFSW